MKRVYVIGAIVVIMPFLSAFEAFMNEQEWVNWSNRFLSESVDPSADTKLKKWEISLTADRFVRFRKTYQQGKQEYYSFNLKSFATLEQIPGDVVDTLRFHTRADDIIYQTYDDPAGDLDSMATQMSIPVKKGMGQRLDSLKEALSFLKQKAL